MPRPIHYLVLLLLLTTSSWAVSIGIGPSVRYMIHGGSGLGMSESLGYEESVSRMLFCDEGLLLFGLRVSVAVTDSFNAIAEGHWRGYEPCHVTQPDSAGHFDPERSGDIAVYSLGLERQLGSWKALLLAEGIYFREEWSDPVTGIRETRDSLAVGPALLIGMDIHVSPGVICYDMGLCFPALTDVAGRISLSYLLP